jgi:hypothetical protein
MPQSSEAFTVDGVVAGTWKWKGDRIAVTPFAPLPRRWKRSLEGEADALASFHRD